jgi:hypothetical protein
MPSKSKKVSAMLASSKKPVVKKTSMKKSPSRKSSMTVKVEEQIVPVVTVVETPARTDQGSVEVHHKYVFIGTCRSCDHMPMSANKLVAVLSIAIAILSGLLISTSLPSNFQMPSISFGSLSHLMTSTSSVPNL